MYPSNRSTLGPALIQTTTSSTKPDKPANIKTSRRTRNSRRIVQKIDPDETLNGKDVREELLHMIDTMPFQPVSKGGEFQQLFSTETFAQITTRASISTPHGVEIDAPTWNVNLIESIECTCRESHKAD